MVVHPITIAGENTLSYSAKQNLDLTSSVDKSAALDRLKSELGQLFPRKIASASSVGCTECISTGIESLDDALAGGLEIGSVSEWGMPHGKGGRGLLMGVLRALTNDPSRRPVLWVVGQPGLQALASSWLSYGVNLQNLYFAKSFKPIDEMKDAFLEPAFSLIVLDCPKPLSRNDYAFLSHQAAKMELHICILQSYSLSDTSGNVWAKRRINVERCREAKDLGSTDSLTVSVVRGSRSGLVESRNHKVGDKKNVVDFSSFKNINARKSQKHSLVIKEGV